MRTRSECNFFNSDNNFFNSKIVNSRVFKRESMRSKRSIHMAKRRFSETFAINN
jgi:hypothetical protein